MKKRQRESINEIARYGEDLREFATLLEQSEAEKQNVRLLSTDATDVAQRTESLRQSLLARAGIVKPVFERVIGRLMQPQPYRMGPDINAWDLALHPHHVFTQHVFARRVADYIVELVGRLEADPELLEAPRTRPGTPLNLGATLQNVVVHGNVNIAQVGGGSVTQAGTFIGAPRELIDLLHQLKVAVSNVQAPDEEKAELWSQIDELLKEVQKPKPSRAGLMRVWGAVQVWTTVEGAWQGWDRVKAIAELLAPHIQALITQLRWPNG